MSAVSRRRASRCAARSAARPSRCSRMRPRWSPPRPVSRVPRRSPRRRLSRGPRLPQRSRGSAAVPMRTLLGIAGAPPPAPGAEGDAVRPEVPLRARVAIGAGAVPVARCARDAHRVRRARCARGGRCAYGSRGACCARGACCPRAARQRLRRRPHSTTSTSASICLRRDNRPSRRMPPQAAPSLAPATLDDLEIDLPAPRRPSAGGDFSPFAPAPAAPAPAPAPAPAALARRGPGLLRGPRVRPARAAPSHERGRGRIRPC